MNMKLKYPPAIVIFCILALSGCLSKEDSLGDRISASGETSSDIAQRYAKADKLISSGEQKLEKGKKLQKNGQSLETDGQRQISEGQEMKLSAIADYCRQNGFRDPSCNQ